MRTKKKQPQDKQLTTNQITIWLSAAVKEVHLIAKYYDTDWPATNLDES